MMEFSDEELKKLVSIVDNGTTHIEVETPDGWVCQRKGCTMDFKHEHTIYDSLKPKADD